MTGIFEYYILLLRCYESYLVCLNLFILEFVMEKII